MERLTFIDTAKFMGIFLMILSHSGLGRHPLNQLIFSFHMPLFFVLLGFVYQYKEIGLRNFLKKNVMRILVPYILFALMISPGLNLKSIACVTYGSWQILGFLNASPLWFLPCYFLAVLIMHYIEKTCVKICKTGGGVKLLT